MIKQYSMRIATDDDVYEIYRMMQRVYSELEDKRLYVCDDLDFVKNHIQKEGFTIIAVDSKLNKVGCFIVSFPEISEENLGRDIGLSEEELDKVAHMESAVVLSEHRGQHLQAKMLLLAEDYMKRMPYRYYMATVSPYNPASLCSLMENGYQIVMCKEKYNGLIRNILCKKIR